MRRPGTGGWEDRTPPERFGWLLVLAMFALAALDLIYHVLCYQTQAGVK